MNQFLHLNLRDDFGLKLGLTKIALEARLKECSNVLTLGVYPNFSDYNKDELQLINEAEKIYYPTLFYSDIFTAMGKPIFPSLHTYLFAQDKIKQTALFNLLSIPHPRTRVFYGERQKKKILEYFQFPFIAKIPKGSAMGRGVYLINSENDLLEYLCLAKNAYIQEYLKIDRDIRVVIIGKKVALAYFRIAPKGEFRTNVAVGGSISFDKVPDKAIDIALYTAQKCNWNDVGIDICCYDNNYYIFEANMKYGKEGFRQAGINYINFMESLIETGQI
ncbi:MAG: ATP-grasp domain-containing protein [Desulfobacterales bacterium]|nr:ATP-grasp domain-containing protein [Desulfobacterales bacterium]